LNNEITFDSAILSYLICQLVLHLWSLENIDYEAKNTNKLCARSFGKT